MVVGAGGIGRMRGIGDPFDPRRGESAPQQREIPGAPPIQNAEDIVYTGKSGRELLDEFGGTDTGGYQTTPRTTPKEGYRRVGTDPEYSPTITQGYGAGGAQVTAPAGSALEKAQIEGIYDASYRTPKQVEPGRNPSAGKPPARRRIASVQEENARLDAQLSKLETTRGSRQDTGSIQRPITAEDAAVLKEYAGYDFATGAPRRPSEYVEGTKVVQTQNRKKPDGFGPIADAALDERYDGRRPVPNTTGSEQSPYYTVQVPVRGRDGQVQARPQTIDPSTGFATNTADSETLREALYSGADQTTTSNAEFAVGVKRPQSEGGLRTPLITSAQYSERLASGRIRSVDDDRGHVADQIQDDGTVVPIYRSEVRDTNGDNAPMYRVGMPTNIDLDKARLAANPIRQDRDPLEDQNGGGGFNQQGATDFDTQIVRTGAEIYTDENGVRRAVPGTGKRVETGPVPFLGRRDIYEKIPGVRRNVETDYSTKTDPKTRRNPALDALSPQAQAGIRVAMGDRAPGGTKEERNFQDTASTFVGTRQRDGRSQAPYIDTRGVANVATEKGQEYAALDQVLNELAAGRNMADPDVADGYKKLAIEVRDGNISPEQINQLEDKRAVAAIADELRKLQITETRLGPVVYEDVAGNWNPETMDRQAVADEVFGTYDSSGNVVQGSYGDFGNGDDSGYVSGVSVTPYQRTGVSDETPMQKITKKMVEETGIAPGDQASRDAIASQAFAEAVKVTPEQWTKPENPVFQANLRRSIDRIAAAPVQVVRGPSAPIGSSPANRAATPGRTYGNMGSTPEGGGVRTNPEVAAQLPGAAAPGSFLARAQQLLARRNNA
ncbi:MAG: hypothetical protein ACR2NF_12615 [Pirellulales bacterium]